MGRPPQLQNAAIITPSRRLDTRHNPPEARLDRQQTDAAQFLADLAWMVRLGLVEVTVRPTTRQTP